MELENRKPTFHFPFQPYAIQEKFMKELYFALENKKHGIFESPTGTGKSLSICCSALQWLKDNNKNIISDLENEIKTLQQELLTDTDEKDWLLVEYEKIQKNQSLASLRQKIEKLKNYNEKFIEMKVRVEKQKFNSESMSRGFHFQNGDKINPIQVDKTHNEDLIDEDADLLPNDTDDKQDNGTDDEAEDTSEEDENINKIYISSRTHSQLSQFVGEIKKTVFKDDTRVVTLASRQHYCINPHVSKLKNINLINERCLDMQKSKSKSTTTAEDGKVIKKSKTNSCAACPYYNQSNINKLKEKILCEIMDMEDLVKNGKETKACPYYASRAALKDAEVVLVPHAWVCGGGARVSRGAVLVCDEAHALAPALARAAPLQRAALLHAARALRLYARRYRPLMASASALALARLLYLLRRLLGMFDQKKGDVGTEEPDDAIIYTPEDFVLEAEIGHLNLREIIEFCKRTKLARKLHGFSQRYKFQILEDEEKISAPKSTTDKKKSFKNFLENISSKKTEHQTAEEPTVSNEGQLDALKNEEEQSNMSAGTCLYAVLELLQLLLEPEHCGRLILRPESLRYLPLQPAARLQRIAAQCRSVILAGGTMEPISEFLELLGGAGAVVVRCGHVVPREHVLALALSAGPARARLTLNYRQRQTAESLNEIGSILRNICTVVPAGVVCFLPSFDSERALYEHMESSGQLEAVRRRKAVFREPKSAADVEKVVRAHAAAAAAAGGALLLSVAGGKLSEGINFSDELCRCVLVAGLPYPSAQSAELRAAMRWRDSRAPGSGAQYYSDLCMKTVNQCIGRALRHARDYACVLLLDERYSRPRIAGALPCFIQNSLITDCTFGKAIGHIAKFFKEHKYKNENTLK